MSNDNNITISKGMTIGCLEILDDGTEYPVYLEAKISAIKEERDLFIKETSEGKYRRSGAIWRWQDDKKVYSYCYTPSSFKTNRSGTTYIDAISVYDFDKAIEETEKCQKVRHYKCRCTKCGKIRYFSEETIRSEPSVCCKPMYCSSKHSYSIKAQNANYRRRQKYENNESVILVDNKEEVIPDPEYCDVWNVKREKELKKQAEKDADIISKIPRVFATNYETDFTGSRYESLDVIECTNSHLESTPVPYYNQRHQKLYRKITVYKVYRCKCYLCGKEKMVTCNRFGIFPPTQYGYRAYNGYWSDVYCDCHQISSFQWIVNDILIKHGINYKVEVEVDGVFGVDNKTPLRFDFAIYKGTDIVAFIECQGEQHFMPVEEFGGVPRFRIQQGNDEKKRKYAKAHEIRLIEIPYKNKQYEKIEHILKSNGIIE